MDKTKTGHAPTHKIGAVSSLSGVPTPTLRIWEVRYGTFTPHKTDGNHRLYTDDDVLKASLLKRLTEQGHAISGISSLSSQELNHLLQLQQSSLDLKSSQHRRSSSVSLAIVGLTLAARIESKKFTLGFIDPSIRITDIFKDLQLAQEAHFAEPVEILLIKVNSLDPVSKDHIQNLVSTSQALQTIVLYSFAQEHIITTLKHNGLIVKRDLITDADLAELINSRLMIDTSKKAFKTAQGAMIPPRKYSDATLMKLAGISSNTLCECPRHVAEIITLLAGFELYSHECLNKSSKDAHLHAHLSSITGSARALFESALEMIAEHEQIELLVDKHSNP